MRLYHFIVIVICAAALGVATVWYEVQDREIGYEMGALRGTNDALRKRIGVKDNELRTMPELERDNLEKLNDLYDLNLKPLGQ
jgi:hypothetical protein